MKVAALGAIALATSTPLAYSAGMQQGRGPIRVPAETADSFEIVAGRADAGLVLVCDHASNALPAAYGSLGLPAAEFARHIAYDIGAAAVTRQLATALGVPAILTRYSRLLIDVNRGIDDPTLVMRLSDGAIIPGNRHLDEAERQRRIERYYRPYHDAVAGVVERCLARGAVPALLGMHSFTERWKGSLRPWHATVLWDDDPRLASPLLDALHAEAARSRQSLVIGDNQPYPGQYEGDTLWQHAKQRGLPHAVIEIRQDLIGDAHGQQAWSERLIRVLPGLPRADRIERDIGGGQPHIEQPALS